MWLKNYSFFLTSSRGNKLLKTFLIPRQYSKFFCKTQYKMNIVYLRHQPNDKHFQINFQYKNDDLNIDRVFNFSRNVTETVNACTERIRTNLEKEVLKKLRKKKVKLPKQLVVEEKKNQQSIDQPKLPVEFFENNTSIDSTRCVQDLFNIHQYLTLKIANQTYSIAFNCPWVDLITLPTSLLAGCYVYPTKLEIQCHNKDDTLIEWYRSNTTKNDNDEWIKLANGNLYLMTINDIGHKLKLICTPKNGTLIGPSVECISKCSVDAGPGPCPFELRHMFTTTKLNAFPNQFRVLSYNLLADLYADSDYSRTTLFPYCPPYALAMDYRKQLLVREILGYNGDIMCCQEVDSKIFDLDLQPLFRQENFSGTFQQKGQTGEGLATFWNDSKFSLIERHGITIGENISKLTIFDELWQKIENNQKLVDRIIVRSTALQVTVLKHLDTTTDRQKILIVANTHLYFHPDADHIRLLQIGFCMIYVQYVYEKVKKDLCIDDDNVSIIFCGDFNSVPECGIYKLMTEGFVPDDFIDFQSNADEAVRGVSLSQPFDIKSAYGPIKYTNFTPLFSACLDYIFYKTNNLRVLQAVPPPSDEELSAHTGLPSVVFPSDHIALIADFEWNL